MIIEYIGGSDKYTDSINILLHKNNISLNFPNQSTMVGMRTAGTRFMVKRAFLLSYMYVVQAELFISVRMRTHHIFAIISYEHHGR